MTFIFHLLSFSVLTSEALDWFVLTLVNTWKEYVVSNIIECVNILVIHIIVCYLFQLSIFMVSAHSCNIDNSCSNIYLCNEHIDTHKLVRSWYHTARDSAGSTLYWTTNWLVCSLHFMNTFLCLLPQVWYYNYYCPTVLLVGD